jgi:hypothetical protein
MVRLFSGIDVEEIAVWVADEDFSGLGGEIGIEFAAIFDQVFHGFFYIGDGQAECGGLDFVLAEVETYGTIFGFELCPVGIFGFDGETEDLCVERFGFFEVFDSEGDVAGDDEVGFHGDSLRFFGGHSGGFLKVRLTKRCVDWLYGAKAITAFDFGGPIYGIKPWSIWNMVRDGEAT